MRILVFSDSHGDVTSCQKVVERIINVDMILHAGDHLSDARKLQALFSDIPVKCVPGNCDFSSESTDSVIEAEGKRIFLTHGHRYGVKLDDLFVAVREKAEEYRCDLAVFGHTHVPVCDFTRKMPVLNPGSIKTSATFGVIEIEQGVLKASVCDAQ